MSYFLCNNAFHTLTVGRSSSNFTITVDSNPIYSAGLGSVNVIGTLYVGGMHHVCFLTPGKGYMFGNMIFIFFG